MFSWSHSRGLVNEHPNATVIEGSQTPEQCLAEIARSNREAIFYLSGFDRHLNENLVIAQLKEIHRKFFQHRGAVVVSGASGDIPLELQSLFTHIELGYPSPEAYRQFIVAVLRDVNKRQKLSVDLKGKDVARLLEMMRGLTFFEVQKIITQAVVEDGVLGPKDLDRVLDAKKRIVERSGVLEYFPHEYRMGDIAGLDRLKGWLRSRETAFTDPSRAKEFGLTPPKGLFLLGVQGCGKSLCAKAVAAEWKLPLLRLDPSNLYNKYYGESEKNLKRAIRTAEAMAPVVLWIDEIEKSLGQDELDGGTSQRIFATFLSWLQEKKESVFVIATANDIAKLPPELVRKGRFDEIFFVDLPDADTRRAILEIHLKKRNRDPSTFDLDRLVEVSDGFSGAELEQAVVSSLYAVFAKDEDLTTESLEHEIRQTQPLSVTMAERIAGIRAWASNRSVPAD